MKRWLPTHRCAGEPGRAGFTLLEILMAITASALILSAIYGVFGRAIRLRDDAITRTREARLRARAELVIRNDLRNAVISGGTLASILEGSPQGKDSGYPGYLKFTTTTATDTEELIAPDLQQVEYYITTDRAALEGKSGLLVRAIDRDLLASVREEPIEEPLLAGVEAMEITFYDGQSWQETWEFSETDPTLPEAVRVIIREATGLDKQQLRRPIEIVVPWTTQPAIEPPVDP